MIFGVGTDLVLFEQMKSACKKQKEFYKYLLTREEIKDYHELQSEEKMLFLTSRFAIKEAFSKAMGTGIGKKVNFQNITVLENHRGESIITDSPFEGNIFLSTSYSETLLVAQVLLEKIETES